MGGRAVGKGQIGLLDARAQHVFQGAAEQDHQTLQHHDDVAVHPELEAELGAALVEEAEQQAGDDDADRVVATHQGHRDAGEAEAFHEVELDLVQLTLQHVEGEKPANMPEITMARITTLG